MEKGMVRIKDAGTVLQVSYEDLDVDVFGGGDYEVIYTLYGEERSKLVKALNDEGYSGSSEEMITAYFGAYLNKGSFSAYCDEHGIKYELFTWLS